jgi:hypothetical protein
MIFVVAVQSALTLIASVSLVTPVTRAGGTCANEACDENITAGVTTILAIVIRCDSLNL